MSVLADPPSCEDGFPPLARPQLLGDAVDEQIDDGVLGEIALAEVLVLGPKLRQIFTTAARDRSRLPVSSVNVSSMSRVDRPRA